MDTNLMQIDESDLPPDKRFGLVFTFVFVGLGAFWLFGGWLPGAIPALVLGGVLGLLTRFRPALLHKPNVAWALFGLALGKVVGTLVMGLIFLAIMTPMAVFFRLVRRDELRLRRGADQSYWRVRGDAAPASSFSDQF